MRRTSLVGRQRQPVMTDEHAVAGNKCKKSISAISHSHILPPDTETLPMCSISHHLLQIKQTHLILKALDESFQEH